jgi:hypothetical protein
MGKVRTKAFDCVEMKNAAQSEILAEEERLGIDEADRRHERWLRTSDDPLASWWREVVEAGRGGISSGRLGKKRGEATPSR